MSPYEVFDQTATFSSREICKLAGTTYRQIDHWTRLELLPHAAPLPGSGNYRRWDLETVAAAAALGALTSVTVRGGSGKIPQSTRRAYAEAARRRCRDGGGWLMLASDSLIASCARDELCDLLADQETAFYVVPVEGIESIRARAAEMRKDVR